MRPGKALAVATRSLARRRGRTAMLVSGVVVGVAFLVLLLGFVEGMRRNLVEKLVGTLPVTHLEVSTRSYGVGALQFDNPFADLDSAAVARIAAMPGVDRVLPMAGLRVAAQLRASFFGRGFATDAAVYGILPDQLGEDLPAGGAFSRRLSGPVPAVVSRKLIDMYNTGFAESNGLPKLNERILVNQDAMLTIGSSSLSPAAFGAPVDHVPLQIVGASDNVPLACISVPIEYVREWNGRLRDEQAAGAYLSAIVVAEDARAVESVARDLEAAGLQVDTGRESAEKIGAIARYLSLAFGLVGVVILFVSGLGIANALALSVLERSREIGVFRAVGASRGNVRTVFLLEALLLGMGGSILGIGTALGLQEVADRLILRSLPDSPLIPATFFVTTWQIMGLALIIGVAVSVLAGVSPALRAARLQPADVLKGA
ncbi:MAG: ABC transporter permease [Gemmatimonadetes bacterium]|nr:ABC transporter permease [Gemmatimonadota bacterium]